MAMSHPARRRLRRPALGRGMRRADRAGADPAVALARRSPPRPARARSTRRAPATACSSCRPSSRSAPGSRRASPALLDWPLENGEGLQILRYRPGAEYKPHYDYFDPAEPGTPAILKRGGQRLASIVCYLNTPEARRRHRLPGGRDRGRPGARQCRLLQLRPAASLHPHPARRRPGHRRARSGSRPSGCGKAASNRHPDADVNRWSSEAGVVTPSNRLVIAIPQGEPSHEDPHHRRRRFRHSASAPSPPATPRRARWPSRPPRRRLPRRRPRRPPSRPPSRPPRPRPPSRRIGPDAKK